MIDYERGVMGFEQEQVWTEGMDVDAAAPLGEVKSQTQCVTNPPFRKTER